MSGKKDFRAKAKWILELTGDLHIVDNLNTELDRVMTIGQSREIQG